MKKMLVAYFLAGLMPYAVASADMQWFFAGGGGLISLDDETDIIDTGNVFLRSGVAINSYLDIGAEVGFTILTDDINDVDHDVQTLMVYLKGNLPVSNDTSLYLLLGASNVKLTEGFASSADELDDDDTAIGIGVQVRNSANSYYTVDYISYYDENEFDSVNADVSANGINFGFISYF